MVLGYDRSWPPPAPMTTIEVALPTKMWDGLQKKAAREGMPLRVYLGLLLSAAYTARVKPQGDVEMEAAVARAFSRRPASIGKRPVIKAEPRPSETPAAAESPVSEPIRIEAPAISEPLLEPEPDPATTPTPEIKAPAIAAAAPALTPGQIRLIRAYRSLKWLPKQIADAVGVDVELVRREFYPGRP
jgi:hypothetical protein